PDANCISPVYHNPFILRRHFFTPSLHPARSTLFPYTTLFRSHRDDRRDHASREHPRHRRRGTENRCSPRRRRAHGDRPEGERARDRKSTRLNSSHVSISYAVFCLKKKRKTLASAKSDSPMLEF